MKRILNPLLPVPSLLVPLLLVVLAGCDSSQKPDLVLVTIDTLRADRLGCYGHTTAESPFLDGMAASGVRFARCQSPIPITLPSHASILTGRIPPLHGVRDNGSYRLPDHLPTLATILSDEGYATGAFIGAFPLDARYGLSRGFDHYDDRLPDEDGKSVHYRERPATEVIASAMEWIDHQGQGRPRFLWLHFFEPHYPYVPTPPFDRRFADRPYDGEVATVDAAVGELLEALEARGMGDALVSVTSDHGEGLGEHGEYSHAAFLYQTTLSVPWILRWPGHLPRGEVVQAQVGLVDVAPTLLSLLDIDVSRLWSGMPQAALESADLRGRTTGRALDPPATAPAGRAFYSETLFPLENYGWSPSFALLEDGHKVIRSHISRGFDLNQDPRELRPLIPEAAEPKSAPPEWVGSRLGQLDALIVATEALAFAAPTRTMSEKEREALVALGYAGGGGTSGSASEAAGGILAETLDRPDATERIEQFERMMAVNELILSEEYGPAIEGLERLRQDEPDNSWIQMRLGEAREGQGDLELALDHYTEADRLRPDWFEVQIDLARLHDQLGRHDRALDYYQRALDLDPGSARLYLEYADLASRVGQRERAGELLDTALGLELDDGGEQGELEAARAQLYLLQGELDAGRPHLERARALSGEAGLSLIEARYLSADGKEDEAVTVLQAALPRLEDRLAGEACLQLGDLARLAGDNTAAVVWYERATESFDGLDLAHNNAAWLLATGDGDPRLALTHARRAVELNPDQPDYRDTLVEALLHAGLEEDAIAETRRALARFPEHLDLQRRAEQLGISGGR